MLDGPPPVNYSVNKANECRTFRNLTPRTRIGVGLAFLAWGTAGLYISDSAEKKLGFEATEKDKSALKEVVPRITVVERDEFAGRGKGES